MKITDICESTTAGSVATVAAPMNGGPLKRSAVGKGVYGKEPAGSLLTGKKTSMPFANSKLNESDGGFQGEPGLVLYIDGKPTITYADLSREKKYSGSEKKYFDINKAEEDLEILKGKYPTGKFELKSEVIKEAGMPSAVIKHKQKLAGMNDAELADHLKDKSDDELKQMAWRHGYGKSSLHYVNRVNKGKKINESELQETDLIIVPGQGHRLKSGFISHAEDRRDHEVEMARSDLHQAHKNSSKIHKLIKNVSEDDGLEGWVQAKITKAADYLNSVCQYLEGKQLQEMTGGVIAGGSGNFEEAADPIAKRITVKKWGGDDEHSWAVLVDGKPAVTGLSKREIPHHKSLVMKKLQEKPQLTGTNEEADHLDEGMGLKQLAAIAAAFGFNLVPNNVGDGTSGRSSADRAYDSYLSQTPSHLIPRYTPPTKDK